MYRLSAVLTAVALSSSVASVDAAETLSQHLSVGSASVALLQDGDSGKKKGSGFEKLLETEREVAQAVQKLRGKVTLNSGGTTINYVDLMGVNTVKDADLEPLKKLKELKKLRLSNNPGITDAGLKDLKDQLKGLVFLHIGGTSVTDAGLKELKDLEGLQDLGLLDGTKSMKVTDEGLKELKGLKELRILYLDLTQVTDAGMNELIDLKKLQFLTLGGTKVTQAGVDTLRKNIPAIKIRR